jgi:hypothetical protein
MTSHETDQPGVVSGIGPYAHVMSGAGRAITGPISTRKQRSAMVIVEQRPALSRPANNDPGRA